MEIIKFKSQLWDAFEKLASHLQITESTLVTVKKNAAGTLHKLRMASDKDLKKLRAASQVASTFLSGEIRHLGGQVSVLRKELPSYGSRVRASFLTSRRAVVGGLEKLHAESQKALEKLWTTSGGAIAFSHEKIAPLASRASAAAKQLTVKAQATASHAGHSALDKLQALERESKEELQRFRATSYEALIQANEKIAPLALRASAAAKQLTLKAQATASNAGHSALGRLQVLERESKEELQKLKTTSHDAFLHTHEKIARFGSRVSTAAKQLAAPFQRAQQTLLAAGKNAINKPRIIREARRARENEVFDLLARSPDAVVVTDNDRRLVAANAIALDLFGISEHNLRNFTMAAFLAQDPFPDVEANPPAFRRHEEKRCNCKIRRLDGGLHVAECVFLAHALPRQHLYKFLNAAPYRITPLVASKPVSPPLAKPESRMDVAASTPKSVTKLPRHGARPVI